MTRHTTVDELVTPDELAAELKIKKLTLYTWRRQRRGPEGFVMSGSLRYRRSAITRWLAEQGDTAQKGRL